MNKEQRIKKLTWKYFWEQKKEEVCKVFRCIPLIAKTIFYIIILVIVFVSTCAAWAYLLITFFPDEAGETYQKYPGLFRINFIINITGWIYFGLLAWGNSNWKKAKKRAVEEVKNGTGRTKHSQ